MTDVYWDDKKCGIAIQLPDSKTIGRIGFRLAEMLNLHLVLEAHYHTSTLAAALDKSSETVSALRSLEHSVCRDLDHVIVFTEEDRSRWIECSNCARDRVSIVPFGVNAPTEPIVGGRGGLAFLGNMYFEPNRRAVVRLATELLPRIRSQIPNTPCTVIGDIPGELRLLCARSQIQVVGEMESPTQHLSTAAIGVAPVSEGSGVRVKILSYIAAGLPVVTTSIGTEGISFPSVFAEDDIGSAVVRCLDIIQCPQKYLPLIRQTQLILHDRHLWPAVAGSAVRAYQNILKRNRTVKIEAPKNCNREPMWIQEVIEKGRFPTQGKVGQAPFRRGIATHRNNEVSYEQR